jgi:uncharacterized Tic20 family protein
MNFDNKPYLFFQIFLIVLSVPFLIMVLISSFIMTTVEAIINRNIEDEDTIKSNKDPE